MRLFVVLTVLASLAASSLSQIPDTTVRQKPAPPAEIKGLSNLFFEMVKENADNPNAKKYVEKVLFCGPRLTDFLLKVGVNGGKSVTIRVPQGKGAPITLKCRAFKTESDISDALSTINIAANKFVLTRSRPLSKAELAYFWSIISWDIQGALIAVDTKKKGLSFLLNASPGRKIFYVEFLFDKK